MIVGLRKWCVNSLNFVAAYLNADIKENIWVRPPDGITIPPGFGCKLQKALYGTKQAGHYPIMLTEIRQALGESFKLKWAEGCESIIGVDITRVDRGFDLKQSCLIQSIINTTWDRTPVTKTPLLAKCNLMTLGERTEGVHWGSRDSTRNSILRQPVGPTHCLPRRCLQHLLGYMAHMTNTCLAL
ncbi:hypothetical protein O181_023635 [Austropuccinia psidii MF-1]|uniref:Reverse transcriptase Ty1/copia-type domain-containing protein n=1 Tax=Austropuccinia psidii MF-1 TaxID=1389203 RepID=A0A9Q3CIW8_9BASI|nr:hypothetical protein [Austropuccinia psidii MF-1]